VLLAFVSLVGGTPPPPVLLLLIAARRLVSSTFKRLILTRPSMLGHYTNTYIHMRLKYAYV